MFHMRLAKLRDSLNLSQSEIAKRLGMARTTYAGYENGSREPDLKTLNKLAEFFGVNLNWLITGSDYKMTEEDEQLLRIFNDLNERDQEYMLDIMRRMAETKKE